MIDGKLYRCHRIIAHAFLGFDLTSPLQIDHRNRNPLNNGIWNLRVVTNQENQFNTDAKGVCVHRNKFEGYIRIDGKYIAKYFKTEDEALQWRNEMKALHYTINEVDYKKVFSQVLRNI